MQALEYTKNVSKQIQRLLAVGFVAFVANLVWEFGHASLYTHYQGGEITHFILTRAALFDAIIIMLFAYPFLIFAAFKKRIWIMVLILLLFAVGLEMWALGTSRWEYTDLMLIVPFIQTGLSPTIQLALTGWGTYLLVSR